MPETAPSAPGAPEPGPPAPDAPRRHRRTLGVNVLAAVAAVVLVGGVAFLVVNPRFDWPTVVEYLFHPRILRGLLLTVVVTVVTALVALVLGLVIAAMRISTNHILRFTSWLYVWFFRSVPTLVLLLMVYNISILVPRIAIGVPFGPELFAVNTVELVNGVVAGVAVFAIQQAAYTSEIIRAALLAVPSGQREAAAAIGLRPWQRMRRVVLPQALRIALPPIANDTITLMKSTSLLAFIAVPDLLYSAQQIYSQNYLIIPLLAVASIWYLVLVSILTAGQHLLESYLRTGSVAPRRALFAQRAKARIS